MAREQARWIGFGVSVSLVGFLGGRIALVVLAPRLDSPNALLLAMIGATLVDAFILVIPLSIAVAVLRYRLFDIDTLINRTLVYGALSACVVGLYALIVGGASALFQSRANLLISLLATGVVAVLFQPLRERVQRWVNRLLYGEREEPYAVLSTLGRRLEGALSPDETLPAVVETVAQALKLPYAAISLRDGEEEVIAASYGVARWRATAASRSHTRARPSGSYCSARALPPKDGRRRSGACWTIWRARRAWPRTPSNCIPNCGARASGWSSRARRSDDACAATCMTGWGRNSPARRSRSPPRQSSCAPIPPPPRSCSPRRSPMRRQR